MTRSWRRYYCDSPSAERVRTDVFMIDRTQEVSKSKIQIQMDGPVEPIREAKGFHVALPFNRRCPLTPSIAMDYVAACCKLPDTVHT